MHPDAARWNEKYRRACGRRRFRVESRLEAVADRLIATGDALEIASGTGASALWLAERGYRVCCADVSVEALRVARQEAHRRRLPLHAVVADSGTLPFIPTGSLQLVVVVRYLDRRLFSWIPQALAPGGQVFYCTFNRRHLVEHPRFNAEFVLAQGELDAAFAGLEREVGGDESTMSWILARRPA
jgi:SAM-dependent methyltransferase